MSHGTTELSLRITVDDESVQRLAERIVHLLHLPDPAEQAKERRLAASKYAMYGGQEPPEDTGLMIGQADVAKLLNVSSRTVYKRHKTGNMPAPVYIGRIKRWGYEEIKAWVDEGCPPQSEWTWPKPEQESATKPKRK